MGCVISMIWTTKKWERRKFKPIKQPSRYYPFPQSGDGFLITVNFPDLAQDLKPYFYDPRPGAMDSNQAELGAAYAYCENHIRFGVLQKGELPSTRTQLIQRLLTEFPSLNNFDAIKILRIIKRYEKKYGRGKWKKNPLYEKSKRYWKKHFRLTAE